MVCGLFNLKKRKETPLPSTLTTSPICPQHISDIDKPVDSTSTIPDADVESLVKALDRLVSLSTDPDVSHSIDSYTLNLFEIPSLTKLIPGLEKLAAKYHVGNFVIIRQTGEKIFESMPLYTRIGMHLLFHGDTQTKLLQNKTVKDVLREQSVRQGRIYDSSESVKSIPSFIKTYNIDLVELEEPDVSKYNCFNDFFSRKLKPNARPVQNQDDPLAICSIADSRLTVYPTVDMAREFWIKSHIFNLPRLLNIPLYPSLPSFQSSGKADEEAYATNRNGNAPNSDPNLNSMALRFNGGSLAIFRLAPADYHRFHCPVDAVIEELVWVGFAGDSPNGTEEPVPNDTDTSKGKEKGGHEQKIQHHASGSGYKLQSAGEGTYYTVNPQAINQDLPVLESNVRSVLYLKLASPQTQNGNKGKGPTEEKYLAIIAIGALLVGSIIWTGGAKPKGTLIRKGEELGYFKYGGSTVVAVWERECGMRFDEDLVGYSAGVGMGQENRIGPVEVLVRAGEGIGRVGCQDFGSF